MSAVQGGAGEGRRSIFAAALRGDNAIRVLILVALIIAFAIASNGLTLGAANIANVLVQSAIRGVAACGQALVVLTAGLDLSVSGVVAVALMTGGALLTDNPQYSMLGFSLSPLLVIPIMLMIGTGFGLANGVIVARLRLPAIIVTLGTWQIGIGLAYQVTGSGFVDRLPDSIAFIGQGEVFSVPIPILIFFAVVAATWYLLHHTRLGAEIYAVGGNPRAAFIAGVQVQRVRIAVFAIAGFLYGIGAVIAMSRHLTSTMTQAAGLELSTIAAVAIGGVSLAGGKGTILGVLLGVLIIGVIDNGLSVMGVGPAATAITKGVIIVGAVAIDALRRR